MSLTITQLKLRTDRRYMQLVQDLQAKQAGLADEGGPGLLDRLSEAAGSATDFVKDQGSLIQEASQPTFERLTAGLSNPDTRSLYSAGLGAAAGGVGGLVSEALKRKKDKNYLGSAAGGAVAGGLVGGVGAYAAQEYRNAVTRRALQQQLEGLVKKVPGVDAASDATSKLEHVLDLLPGNPRDKFEILRTWGSQLSNPTGASPKSASAADFAKDFGSKLQDYAGKGLERAKGVLSSALEAAKPVTDHVQSGLKDPSTRPLYAAGIGSAAGGIGGLLAEAMGKRKRKRYLSSALGGAAAGGLLGGGGAYAAGEIGDVIANQKVLNGLLDAADKLPIGAEEAKALVKSLPGTPLEKLEKLKEMQAAAGETTLGGVLGTVAGTAPLATAKAVYHGAKEVAGVADSRNWTKTPQGAQQGGIFSSLKDKLTGGRSYTPELAEATPADVTKAFKEHGVKTTPLQHTTLKRQFVTDPDNPYASRHFISPQDRADMHKTLRDARQPKYKAQRAAGRSSAVKGTLALAAVETLLSKAGLSPGDLLSYLGRGAYNTASDVGGYAIDKGQDAVNGLVNTARNLPSSLRSAIQ